MVTTQTQESYTRIVLTPNRSLNWRGNQLVILSLLLVSSVISVGFALIGAWVILPFAGLEITALTVSLYYVSWKLSYCHILTVKRHELVLEKGVRFPKYARHFPLKQLTLVVEAPQHDWDPPAIYAACNMEKIVFGEFLSKADKAKLIQQLRDIPLRIQTLQEHRLTV